MKKKLSIFLVLLCGVTFSSFSKSNRKISSSAKKKTLELCCVTNTQTFVGSSDDGGTKSVTFSTTVCTGGYALSAAVAKAIVDEAVCRAYEK